MIALELGSQCSLDHSATFSLSGFNVNTTSELFTLPKFIKFCSDKK